MPTIRYAKSAVYDPADSVLLTEAIDNGSIRRADDGTWDVVYRDAAGKLISAGKLVDDHGVALDATSTTLFADFSDAHRAVFVEGSDGGDVIAGGALNDRLLGRGGDDVLTGGAGADALFGGLGSDTASYAGSARPVTIDLGAGTASGGDAQGDTLTGIENLLGSDGSDTLTGDAGDNVIDGGAGSDVLDGGDGIDTLSLASLTVNRGNYIYVSMIDGYTQQLTGGNPSFDEFKNFENVIGSQFSDYIEGTTGSNRLEGAESNDVLAGYGGGDTLDGGEGNDTVAYHDFHGAGPAVVANLSDQSQNAGGALGDHYISIENLEGAAGDDILTGDAEDNYLDGAAGDDLLAGGGGADYLDAGQGDDVLVGGAGGDAMIGGDGYDTVSYADAASGVTMELGSWTSYNAGGGDAEGDYLKSIEKIVGSSFDDVLFDYGGTGTDLIGGDGNDEFHVQIRYDRTNDLPFETIAGGAGSDTVVFEPYGIYSGYTSTGEGVDVDLQNGTVGRDATGLTLSGIENVIGGRAYDTIYGDAGTNTLGGGEADDQLYGRDGDDTLQGGNGSDLLVGGTGADQLDGGDDDDTVDYSASTAGVIVDLAAGTGAGGDAEGDTLVSIEKVVGSAFDDVLTASATGSTLTGGAGSDQLVGGAGNDTLIGGDTLGDDAADIMDGGAGFDAVLYYGNLDSHIDLSGATANTGNAAGDVIRNVELLLSGAGNDTLIGTADANLIDAGGGDDTIVATAGKDIYAGSFGFDTVTYGDFAHGVVAAITFSQTTETEALGMQGIERLIGSAFDDQLIGDDMTNDQLFGGDGHDTLTGGGGDDVLGGGDGAVAAGDTLDGGDGNDTVSYADADGRVTVDLTTGATGILAAGDELISVEGVIGSRYADELTGGTTASTVEGGGGDDVLTVGSGGGSFFGGDGNDTVVAGRGVEAIDGGDGFDAVDYSASDTGVTLANDGTAGSGGAAGDTAVAVEGLIGSAFGDVLSAIGDFVSLVGNAGDDILTSVAATGVLDGGAGADRLVSMGAPGTASYASATRGVRVSLTDPSLNTGDAAGDRFINIGNLTGSHLADRLTGDAGANRIDGNGGHDRLVGGDGDDILVVYDDTLSAAGGDGTDTLHVAAGTDRAVGSKAFTGWELAEVDGDARVSFAQLGTAVTVVSTSVEGSAAEIVGTRYGDTITGGIGSDSLTGGAGNDTIILNSADVEKVLGGNGFDTLVLNAAGGRYVFDSTVLSGIETVRVAAGVSVDLSGLSTGVTVIAADGATVIGTAAADVITTGATDDVVRGGGGADRMTGGDGADTFAWASLAEMGGSGRTDRVLDFSAAAGDRLDLSAIDADATAPGHQSFSFVGTDAFTGADDRYEIRVVAVSGGNQRVEFDINHDKVADASFVVHADAPLVASDFVL